VELSKNYGLGDIGDYHKNELWRKLIDSVSNEERLADRCFELTKTVDHYCSENSTLTARIVELEGAVLYALSKLPSGETDRILTKALAGKEKP
jgi:hypothetical protein